MSSSANVRVSVSSAPDSLAHRARLMVIPLLALAAWLVVAAVVAGIASLL